MPKINPIALNLVDDRKHGMDITLHDRLGHAAQNLGTYHPQGLAGILE